MRFADEIVDTFHDYDKKKLLDSFEEDYHNAIKEGISLNPILHSFQLTVKKYNINEKHIAAFLKSMKADLDKIEYKSETEIKEYIYGSADVVGLMCLKVFVYGDDQKFNELEEYAMKLGSAFQKVNFLRDLKNDIVDLDRRYFPNIDKTNFNEESKNNIIADIQSDFDQALLGIKKLPKHAKLPVFIAYRYYLSLLKKIKRTPAEKIISVRIRISDFKKMSIFMRSSLMNKLNLL